MHKFKNKKGEKKVYASCSYLESSQAQNSMMSERGWDEMSLESLEGVTAATVVPVDIHIDPPPRW